MEKVKGGIHGKMLLITPTFSIVLEIFVACGWCQGKILKGSLGGERTLGIIQGLFAAEM